jgi:hypothetical protein
LEGIGFELFLPIYIRGKLRSWKRELHFGVFSSFIPISRSSVERVVRP